MLNSLSTSIFSPQGPWKSSQGQQLVKITGPANCQASLAVSWSQCYFQSFPAVKPTGPLHCSWRFVFCFFFFPVSTYPTCSLWWLADLYCLILAMCLTPPLLSKPGLLEQPLCRALPNPPDSWITEQTSHTHPGPRAYSSDPLPGCDPVPSRPVAKGT